MKRICLMFTAAAFCLALSGCGASGGDSSSASVIPRTRMDEYYASLSASSSSEESINSEPSASQGASSGTSSSGAIKPPSSGGTSSASTPKEPEKPKVVRVTIPEGYSAAQIFKKLEQSGVCSSAQLLSAMQSSDFSSYSFVANMGSTGDGNRCFKLEGYLYPNTYEFYLDSTPEQAIKVLLGGAKGKIGSAHSGFTVDQTVTVASLIEREVSRKADMPMVASVIYNRLAKGMRLQLDASIVYVENYVKPYIGGDINRYNASYNTNKCSGLPAGPICNPGSSALNAALNPADTNYLYFVTNKSTNETYFAETYEQHKENCIKAGVDPDKI